MTPAIGPHIGTLLIAGVSGSGKSHLAAELRRADPSFSMFEMDVVLRALDLAKSSLGGDPHRSHEDNVAAMSELGPALGQVTLQSGARTILEGGWIEPSAWGELVRAHGGCSAAIFCGYPSAAPDAILARLSGTGHWLSRGGDRAFVEAQITHSQRLQQEMAGLPNTVFLDVSEGFRTETEMRALLHPFFESISC